MSQRLAKNPQVVHTESFDAYVDDLHQFIDTIVEKGTKRYGVGYSMGGMITTMTAGKYPKDYDAFVAMVPPYSVNLRGFPKYIARALIAVKAMLGQIHNYAYFQKDLDPANPIPELSEESHPRLKLEANLMLNNPEVTMGGASFGWIGAAMNASNGLKHLMRNIQVPHLLINAKRDKVVIPAAIDSFAKKSSGASLFVLPDAPHTIMSERDGVRHLAVMEMMRFFVNPTPLNVPAERDEITPLVNASERYLQRGDKAMARYAMDEAMRVLEWKQSSLTITEDRKFMQALKVKNAQVWKALLNADVYEQGLYLHLDSQRQEEMKKLYGRQTPPPSPRT